MPLALLSTFACSSLAAPAADEVTALPGWTGPLPMKMYSGYVNASDALGIACQVHYWYLESEGAPGPPLVHRIVGSVAGAPSDSRYQ